MRLQLPTVICVCVSLIIMITLIVFMNANEEGVNREAVNVESEEFKTAREFAAVAFNAKRYTQAIEHYKVALRMRPENAYVHNDLGATYYEFGLAHAGPNWPSWDTDLSGRTVAEALRELLAGLVDEGVVDASLSSDDPLGFVAAHPDVESLVQAAYRFCRHEPGAHVILSGTGNVAHLEANVAHIQAPKLPDEVADQLEALFGSVDSVSGN